jgi:hypothetical protein
MHLSAISHGHRNILQDELQTDRRTMVVTSAGVQKRIDDIRKQEDFKGDKRTRIFALESFHNFITSKYVQTPVLRSIGVGES